ncbi:MAG: adenylyltransferase/cytidyltransferase family protein [Lachnospiraceae bacterium]
MTAEKLIRELPKGLIKWYEFPKGDRALYITGGRPLDQSLQEALSECGLRADCMVPERLAGCSEKYSCILLSTAVEMSPSMEAAISLFRKIRTLLEEDGRLFVVTDNRMAIRYFCGDQDPFTGRNFDGIENYRRAGLSGKDAPKGRLYTRAELEKMLESAGFFRHKFYSVYPEITCPQILFAEDYSPEEELGVRIFPQYHSPDTVFLEEESLYTSLIENGLFHRMANGFLIECPMNGVCSEADQITVSMERGRENALCTILTGKGTVVKKPLYEEGRQKLERLKENQQYLELHGIRMIKGEIMDRTFVMPRVQGMPLVTYFRSLLTGNRTEFFRRFDELWELILQSSEHTTYEEVEWEHCDPWWDEEKDERKKKKIDRGRWRKIAFGTAQDREYMGPVLRRGYLDLVLLNGFVVNGEYVFFDQELYVENLPAKAIMLRNIDLLYRGDLEVGRILPRKELLERYGIEPCRELYYAQIRHFLTRLRNDDLLSGYHRSRRRSNETVHSNRQRMNYSAEEYQRLFVDIFKNTENKKLYLFGSGNFARKFLALYGEEYEIAGILDNQEEKWGTDLEGIPVMSPAVLKNMDPAAGKVIICIKNYVEVLKQVREYGVRNVGIYDTAMEYSRKQKTVAALPADAPKKKYHTGYVAGVFDLFHIGHLNLLRRAKEQCDYLIAGVVTDEGVRKNKGTDSFIPFEERLSIVQSCRYVDEAVGIPLEFCDTRDAYLKFQFDVQFSGSDYAQDPAWLKKQEFLRKHGAELVFFPYTESTSSTKLKEMIGRKLL